VALYKLRTGAPAMMNALAIPHAYYALVNRDMSHTRGRSMVILPRLIVLFAERVRAALVFLGAFETEMPFALSDQQEIIRVRSERAFAHLQRSIVADPEFGGKWCMAFQKTWLRDPCLRIAAPVRLTES
jgi:hypothetical protein